MSEGEIVGFLGPNGSGKTTTIRMICGLLRPDGGEGTCLGHDIVREAEAIKREVGYMTQRFSLYEDLTIRENLEFVGRLYALPDLRHAVDETLEGLGLKGRQRQLAGTLSGGWKQRLALASCIMHKPKLLLLDEPTAGVDPKARREFWDEIHRLAERRAHVLVSTHYMDEAERCHRIVYIAYGTVVARGTRRRSSTIPASRRSWSRARASQAAARALEGMPGVEQVAAFGQAVHVVGSDCAGAGGKRARGRGALSGRGGARRDDARGRLHSPDERSAGGGERLMAPPRDRSHSRRAAEGIHPDAARPADIRHDPRHPDHAARALRLRHQHRPEASADRRRDRRFRARRARHRCRHADLRLFPHRRSVGEAEARTGLADGALAFVVTIPRDFHRDLVRGRTPDVVIEADASDPTAAANAIAAMPEIVRRAIEATADGPSAPESSPAARERCRAPPLQSGGRQHLQHRAGADRHHPHHDDDADDGAGADARDRARHDGDPSRHAASAARDHDRQDRAVYRHRLRAGPRHPEARRWRCSPCRSKDR